jgi:Uma2 family endonuclease
MGMVVPTLYTAEKVRALPDDGKRHEVIDGELIMTPAPGWLHQRAVGRLFLMLSQHLAATGYEAILSPADVELDSRTLVQPDLFVTRLSPGRPSEWRHLDLVLAVEVLSPSTARYDRLTKRRLYQRQGIEYWIVDLDGRVFERWLPSDERPEILATELRWQPAEGTVALRIELEAYFGAVLDQ